MIWMLSFQVSTFCFWCRQVNFEIFTHNLPSTMVFL